MAVRLHVWGERACFTRPEMKVERVSYDAMTPSAARGILEAIHWKPAIRWQVDRIHVLKPIRFQSLHRNEVKNKIPVDGPTGAASAFNRGYTNGLGMAVEEVRLQRNSLVLVEVAYIIEAHFDMTAKAGRDDSPGKHIAMFNRRASQGQCFHRPCLGTREFAAEFALIPEGEPLPSCKLPPDQRDADLGWMLYDIDFTDGRNESRFFRAEMRGGVIDVEECLRKSGVSR